MAANLDQLPADGVTLLGAGVMLIIFAGRGGNTGDFVRKDGRTAFRVSAKPLGTTQLKALARSLGVPYYDLFSGSSIDV